MKMKIAYIFFLCQFIINTKCMYIESCSDIFCATRQPACVSLDEKCICNQEKLHCPTLNPNRFHFYYDQFDNQVDLFGQYGFNTTVSDALKLWAPYFASLTASKVNLIDFCDHTKQLVPFACLLNATDLQANSMVFDFNLFPFKRSIEVLELNSDCLHDVISDINSKLPNLIGISLRSNYFTQIPYAVQNLTNLRGLTMSSNYISNLSRKIFSKLYQLQELFLSGNCIESLQPDTFDDLYQLKVLTIGYNGLKSLPEKMLHLNSDLQTLDLSFNELEELPRNFLHNKYVLRNLILAYNKLKVLDRRIFASTKNLKNLKLQHNRLTSLDPNLFQFTPQLENLDLSNNNFIRMPVIFLRRYNYLSIDLTHNNITIFDLPVTSRIANAKKLDLSYNCIQKIRIHNYQLEPVTATSIESGIHHFKCVICCLKDDIFPDIFTNLQENIDISSNMITKLNMTHLNTRRSRILTKLDLGNNSISDIVIDEKFTQKSNKTNSIMLVIDLWNNPINCNCKIIPIFEVLYSTEKWFFTTSFDTDYMMCKKPNELKGKIFTELDWKNLYCTVTRNCPISCACFEFTYKNQIVVNCSHTKLTEFPTYLPNTSSDIILDLQYNNISSLPPKHFLIWDKIKDLDLSYNTIQSTANLNITSNLRNVKLNNNHLTSYEQSLEKLFAIDNISRTVTLSGNLWLCSCELIKLRNVMIKSRSRLLDLDKMECTFKNSRYGFNHLDQFCPSDPSDIDLVLRATLPICALIVIVISALCVFFARRKLEIQYFCFREDGVYVL
uniref:LRRCT domain-containing protein n=1 Tax=Strigamia maritima TaxID=126957 RepID=T1JLQ8_STRMM